MRVIPVLDLKERQVVRGVAGQRDSYRPIVSRLTPSSNPQDVARAFVETLEVGLEKSDIDFIVLHQANMRMNQAVEKRLRRIGFEAEVYHDIADYAK